MKTFFNRDYTTVIAQLGSEYFSDLQHKLKGSDTFDALVENVPSYGDIANNLRQLSDKFDKFIETSKNISELPLYIDETPAISIAANE